MHYKCRALCPSPNLMSNSSFNSVPPIKVTTKQCVTRQSSEKQLQISCSVTTSSSLCRQHVKPRPGTRLVHISWRYGAHTQFQAAHSLLSSLSAPSTSSLPSLHILPACLLHFWTQRRWRRRRPLAEISLCAWFINKRPGVPRRCSLHSGRSSIEMDGISKTKLENVASYYLKIIIICNQVLHIWNRFVMYLSNNANFYVLSKNLCKKIFIIGVFII